MTLMGIDIGTTGVKAAVFSLDGKIINLAYQDYKPIRNNAGWFELNPDEVWNSTKSVIKKAAAKAKNIKALSISTLGGSLTPVDKNGNSLYNTITAADTRGSNELKIFEKYGREKVYRITGAPLHPAFCINKIAWIKNNLPSVYKKTWKFMQMEELFFSKLGLEPIVDYSLASATMCFDVSSKRWSKEILNLVDLDEDKLAIPKRSGEVIGEISDRISKELGLSKGTLIVTGGYDQPMAALGAGIIKEGSGVDSIGTVECITVAFSKPDFNKMAKSNYCICPHVYKDMFVTLAYNYCAGDLLRWYKTTFERTAEYGEILKRVKDEPSSILILPHFIGSGTPYLDPFSKGAILGLTLSTSKSDIVKGVLESACYEMKVNIEELKKLGINTGKLYVIGGGAKSSLNLQMRADMFQKEIISLEIKEAGCAGAAILAGYGAGIYGSIKDAVKLFVKEKERFHARPKWSRRYDRKFKTYREIYDKLKRINTGITY